MVKNNKYNKVVDYGSGLRVVELNGKYGFINEAGKEVILGLS